MGDELFGLYCMFGLVGLGLWAFSLIAWWQIFQKAGFDGARAFLLLIPFVNLIIMIMFAFGEWPMRREIEQLRMQLQFSQRGGPNVQQISISTPQQMQQPYPQQQYPQPYPNTNYPPQYPESQYPR